MILYIKVDNPLPFLNNWGGGGGGEVYRMTTIDAFACLEHNTDKKN